MEMNDDIYPNADNVARARSDFDDNSNEDMKKVRQKPGKSESRRWRLSVVCRVLLCAPLLVAALLLCLKFTGHIKTSECDQLQMRYDNLTVERDQLQMRYDNLTVERVQLQKERNDLKEWISNLTQNFPASDGWVYFGSSFYKVSTEKKNWNQSREDCKMRGAILVIVNSTKEQDFVKTFHKPSGSPDWIWIGLSVSEKEGTWKWVDGSPLGSWSIWGTNQPNDKEENCVAVKDDWHDHDCSSQHRWICEKRIELN